MAGVPNNMAGALCPYPSRAVSTLELQGQARVVRYLRERANEFSRIADGMHYDDLANIEFKRTINVKAITLRDTAHMVQEGISRALTEYFGQVGPHTVCPSCGHFLAIHGHGECGSPCYDDHIEKCPCSGGK